MLVETLFIRFKDLAFSEICDLDVSFSCEDRDPVHSA